MVECNARVGPDIHKETIVSVQLVLVPEGVPQRCPDAFMREKTARLVLDAAVREDGVHRPVPDVGLGLAAGWRLQERPGTQGLSFVERFSIGGAGAER